MHLFAHTTASNVGVEWLGNAMSEVNYWAVLWAVVSSLVVGSIWYHEKVFGPAWRGAIGLKKKDMENTEGMGAMFGGTIIFNTFTAAFLQAVMLATDTSGVNNGFILGAIFGLVFAGFPHVVHALFERKNSTYFGLALGHDVLTFAVMGGVLGAFV